MTDSGAPVRLVHRDVPGPPGTSGVPVVLLHGGGDGSTWDPFVAPLASRGPVVVPDLRGAGAAPASGPRP